jgi:hypothetical protein
MYDKGSMGTAWRGYLCTRVVDPRVRPAMREMRIVSKASALCLTSWGVFFSAARAIIRDSACRAGEIGIFIVFVLWAYPGQPHDGFQRPIWPAVYRRSCRNCQHQLSLNEMVDGSGHCAAGLSTSDGRPISLDGGDSGNRRHVMPHGPNCGIVSWYVEILTP